MDAFGLFGITWIVFMALFIALVVGIRNGRIPIKSSIEDEEYERRVEQVRQNCDERIAALRVEYEKRIDELESQIKILFELLRGTEMAPQVAAMERQHEVEKQRQKIYVLGIWPDSDLNTTGERDAVYNAGFEYRALSGADVKRVKILRELQKSKVDILEVGAHGDVNGIVINNANFSGGWWENALRNANTRVKVALLLACFSDSSVADAMKRAGVEHVISVDGELSDNAAVEFAQQFYQEYANGNDVSTAFDNAKLVLDYRDAEKIVLR